MSPRKNQKTEFQLKKLTGLNTFILSVKEKKDHYEIAEITDVQDSYDEDTVKKVFAIVKEIHGSGFFDNSAHNTITLKNYSLNEEKIKSVLKSRKLTKLKKFVLIVTLSTNNYYQSDDKDIKSLIDIVSSSDKIIENQGEISWSRSQISQMIFPKILRESDKGNNYHSRVFTLNKFTLKEYYSFLRFIDFLSQEQNDQITFKSFLKENKSKLSIDYSISFKKFSQFYNLYCSKNDFSSFCKNDIEAIIFYINNRPEKLDPLINKIFIDRFKEISELIDINFLESFILTKEEYEKFNTIGKYCELFQTFNNMTSHLGLIKEKNRFHALLTINSLEEVLLFIEEGLKIDLISNLERSILFLTNILKDNKAFEKICKAVNKENDGMLQEWKMSLYEIPTFKNSIG